MTVKIIHIMVPVECEDEAVLAKVVMGMEAATSKIAEYYALHYAPKLTLPRAIESEIMLPVEDAPLMDRDDV